MGLLPQPLDAVRVPREIRAALPRGAVVRLLHPLAMTPGDTLVVYETGDWVEPKPVVVVIRDRKVVARYRMAALFGKDIDLVYSAGSEFRLSPERGAVALMFRNSGDGSVSPYVILSANSGRYSIILKKLAGQGRLRIMDEVGNLELWDAISGSEECVWCRHRYIITRYSWNGTALERRGSTRSRRRLDPSAVAARPIVMEFQRKPSDGGKKLAANQRE